ncbi:hypothetical protein DH2020_030713 [Rehmannia glutinosa]|uniref:Dirigent protein n=1 Tax=Rehmannia glutinosa TaxID=99300 RepID=A0ABR0VK00_REHGL
MDDDWFEKVDQSKEIRTKLHFYFHDNATGEHQSVWVVAKSEITHISPTNFGLIYMVDNLMTVGPEPSSEVLGRVQGSPGFADLNNTAFALGLNFVFTEGKYKGSSICVLGRNPVLEKVREVPIVGGTGVFRMARGIAITSLFSHKWCVRECNRVTSTLNELSGLWKKLNRVKYIQHNE